MRKHDVNYYEKTNIIEFYSEFCTHSRRIETTNKQKNIHFEKKSFLNQSNHFKLNDSIKNSKKSSMIVIKILSRKETNFDQSAISLFRKDKKQTKSVNKGENPKTIRNIRLNLNEFKISNSMKKLSEVNIAMIEASASNMMSKRKNVSLFSIILRDVEKHLEKHNKSNTMIKNVLSLEYHEFLNVFDKKSIQYARFASILRS